MALLQNPIADFPAPRSTPLVLLALLARLPLSALLAVLAAAFQLSHLLVKVKNTLKTRVSGENEYLYGDTVTILLTIGSGGTSGLWSHRLWRTEDNKQSVTMWVQY